MHVWCACLLYRVNNFSNSWTFLIVSPFVEWYIFNTCQAFICLECLFFSVSYVLQSWLQNQSTSKILTVIDRSFLIPVVSRLKCWRLLLDIDRIINLEYRIFFVFEQDKIEWNNCLQPFKKFWWNNAKMNCKLYSSKRNVPKSFAI